MIKFDIIDFNQLYKEDMKSSGFVINTNDHIDKSKKFTPNGIYSNRFNHTSSEHSASCQCGNYRGSFYVGSVCVDCGTIAKTSVKPLATRGWILFERYYVIHPTIYRHIEKLVGAKALEKIINFEGKIDIDGQIIENDNPKMPYANLGLIAFREQYQEILDYYHKKSKKHDVYEFLMEHKDKTFIDKFPVISLLLRQALLKGSSLSVSDINRYYTTLAKSVSILQGSRSQVDSHIRKIEPILFSIQELTLNIATLCLEKVSGKRGVVRNEMLGFRANFTSRTVIVPTMTKDHIDEVDLPYLTFIELYRYELMNRLIRIDGETLEDADNIMHSAKIDFSERVYQHMMDYIDEHDAYVIINRAPTIAYGSMLSCRVKRIKKDMADLTMSLSVLLLGLLAGDSSHCSHC